MSSWMTTAALGVNRGYQRKVHEGARHALFSTLILAVSSLPFSSSIAISRRAAFAWAPFFSWRVLSRCIASLPGRSHALRTRVWTRDADGAPELDLSQDRCQEGLLRAYGRAPLAFAFADTQGAMLNVGDCQ